ncbi:TIGR03089 family protein [Stackebrandtia soli]|uniref:TIGR03089 family protein n=1 Tax=Stackebrandtia soli TaxID=1892856 RepID=UPI0039EB3F57
MTTIPDLFAASAARDAARPFLTYYDDATGERTELSYATIDNWVSKTANLLVDGAGLGPGGQVSVNLPPHWLTGVIMLGAWRAGAAIRHDDAATDAAFVDETLHTEAEADEVYAVALAPMAVGLRTESARAAAANGEVTDYLTEVRTHGDHYGGPRVSDDAPALVALPRGGDLSQAALVEAARERAAELGLNGGERVLIATDRPRPLDWLLAPLASAGGVVLCVNSGAVDLAKRAASENARTLTL